MRIQIIIAVCLVLVLFGIMNSVRKHKLDIRYALSWMFCMVCMLIVDIFPGLIEWLSSIMGIDLPLNMVLFWGFFFCLLLIFGQTVNISMLSEKTKRLTQEVALLEKEIEQLQENKEL